MLLQIKQSAQKGICSSRQECYKELPPSTQIILAEKAGADIIVATGFDEGGTLPGTALGTFSIVPLIADSVKRVLTAKTIELCETAWRAAAL